MNPVYPKKRFFTLDIARALAIILVAIGHFDVEPMPGFYQTLRRIIYLFHMPLFMFVSGFLCVGSLTKKSYLNFIKDKFMRLMVPYFTVSVIVICIKLLTERFMPVDHPVTAWDFIEILWLPKAGFYLWFVYALWWMMVIAPVFKTPGRRIVFFLLTVPFYFCFNIFPETFCLKQTAQFAIYFSAGMVMYDVFRRIPIRKICLAAFILFFPMAYITVSGCWLAGVFKPLVAIFYLLTAFSGIGFSIAISNALENHGTGMIRSALYAISAASYIIYLFHTTFMGFAKAILVKLNFFAGANLMLNYTIAELIVPILAGVVVPSLLYLLLKRFHITRLLFGLTSGTKQKKALTEGK